MLMFKKMKQILLSKGKIVSFYKDILETPDGNIVEYDYLMHNFGGGAGALVVDENDMTYLVKQYRNSINDLSIEIPAGGYSFKGESGEDCARREIEEELGVKANRMIHISNIVSSIGTFDEKTDVYIALDLEKGKQKLDDGEYIEILKIDINEAINMVYNGKINDSKTIIALLAYRDLKYKGEI
ncbi:MAG: NUDIX hydrolase [Lachnospiraceae bacterium]|nr:NUDIX hydrolase [Lachnospiraceae bacterium]